jgi:transposase
MPRTTNPYTAEFSEKIAALAHSGRSVEDLAKEFEPCLATIHGFLLALRSRHRTPMERGSSTKIE